MVTIVVELGIVVLAVLLVIVVPFNGFLTGDVQTRLVDGPVIDFDFEKMQLRSILTFRRSKSSLSWTASIQGGAFRRRP